MTTVRQLLDQKGREILSIDPSATVFDAVAKMAEIDVGSLVVMDDDAPPEKLTLRAGSESRRGYGQATDIIPVRESVFQRRRHIVGTLSEAASTDGKIVYERG